jgi:hypothetical protein
MIYTDFSNQFGHGPGGFPMRRARLSLLALLGIVPDVAGNPLPPILPEGGSRPVSGRGSHEARQFEIRLKWHA